MNAEEFEQKTGYPPIQDDLERVNCKQVGEAGHWQCGWCKVHDLPRFACACETAASHYGLDTKWRIRVPSPLGEKKGKGNENGTGAITDAEASKNR
jgi:hypothetical protein